MATAERQGVHVEEVDPVLDVVLDQHPLGVAADELGRRLGPTGWSTARSVARGPGR